jgi:hypothetical protein
MTLRHAVPVPLPGESRPSATRGESNRRQRHVEEAKKGNRNAMKHGVFAVIANAPDVAMETALIYAARPSLDPIADRRIVEQLATASVQYARATVALSESDNWGSTLVAAARDFGNRAERLERAVHQRAQERAREAAKPNADDLAQYRRPKAVS